jgi:hypothetical protein
MDLLDEEGNLLGTVNVVDAFVVLAFVAVVMAGGTLISDNGQSGDEGAQPTATATVTSSPVPTEEATRYVTVELGTLPSYVVAQMEPGDVVATNGDDTMTLTDVYASPVGEDGAAVTVRVRIDGHYRSGADRRDVTIRFGNGTVGPGSQVSLGTAAYEVSGTIVAVDRKGESVATETVTTTVTVSAVSPERAAAVKVGMREQNTAGTYAQVTGKQSDPARVVVADGQGNLSLQTHPVMRDVKLTIELTVRETPNGYRYDGKPLTIGSVLTLDFDRVTVEGSVGGFGEG